MRYALMGDVHANPSALKKAIEDARDCGVERMICLGDISGYGWDAKAALELVRHSMDVTLIGNHDAALLGMGDSHVISSNPNLAVDVLQREQLSDEDKKWLRSRPYTHAIEEHSVACTHGDFLMPEQFAYVDSPYAVGVEFSVRKERVLFCAHTHEPGIWTLSGGKRISSVAYDRGEVHLKPRNRYLVNVGSVGYPRRTFKSQYVIYDTESDTVEFRSLPYDWNEFILELQAKRFPLPEWIVDVLSSRMDRR